MNSYNFNKRWNNKFWWVL